MYVVALGFLFLLTLSRYISVHHICAGGECRNVRHPQAGWFGASELSVHSFMDGFAIGLASRRTFMPDWWWRWPSSRMTFPTA